MHCLFHSSLLCRVARWVKTNAIKCLFYKCVMCHLVFMQMLLWMINLWEWGATSDVPMPATILIMQTFNFVYTSKFITTFETAYASHVIIIFTLFYLHAKPPWAFISSWASLDTIVHGGLTNSDVSSVEDRSLSLLFSWGHRASKSWQLICLLACVRRWRL